MATTLQFRRYDTANIANLTGSVGEIFIDMDKDTVVVQDGSTAGGFPLAREGAYLQANAAMAQANAARFQANNAYAEANLKLNLAGGTITGNLVISGNLEVLGNSTTLNVETLSVEDNEITLNSNVTGAPTLNAYITINRGTSPNANLVWNEGVGQWQWNDGDGVYYSLDSALDAYAQANSARDQANSARGQANTGYGQANDAYGQANSARDQANTARDTANGAYAQANGAYGQANGAYGQANGAYAQANGAYDQANGAYGQANTAYGQANAAYGQANAAYADSNTRVLRAGDTMTGTLSVQSHISANVFRSTNTTLSAPSTSTFDGERLRLYDFNQAGHPNYAIGVEGSHIWHGVDDIGPTLGFKWYGNTTLVGLLRTNSTFEVSNTVSAKVLKASGTGTAVDASSGDILTNKVTGTEFAFLNGLYTTTVRANNSQIADYTFRLPSSGGTDGFVLSTDGTGNTLWSNSIYALANLVRDQANTARDQANTARGTANDSYAQANSARDQANTAYGQANAAYADSNTRVLKVGDTMTGTLNVQHLIPTANITYDLGTSANRFRDLWLSNSSLHLGEATLSAINDEVYVNKLNVNILSAASGINIAAQAGDSYSQANSARDQANTARGTANDSYAQANSARDQANTARGTANDSYAQANSARDQANTARDQANTARGQANAGYAQANNAYDTANLKLNLTGGTVTGDLSITGNLFVSGSNTLLNVSNLSVNDSIIFLANGQVGDSYDIGFVGHFDRGNTKTHAGFFRKATENRFYLFDNYDAETTNNIIDITGNNFRTGNLKLNTLNADSFVTTAGLNVTDQANTARDQANSARLQANNAYAEANLKVNLSGDTMTGTLNVQHLIPTTNVTYDLGTSTKRFRDLYLSGSTIYIGDTVLSTAGDEMRANTFNAAVSFLSAGLNVLDQANTARNQANTARNTANGAYSQANGAYGQANGAYAHANIVYDQANTAYGQANSARDQANTARDVANASYGQANTARDQANTARDTANGAYSQANGAYAQANGAYAHANIVYAQANTARDVANASYGQANSARDQANTARDTANGAYAQANGAYAHANIVYAQANTARDTANGAYAQANGAYAQANGAYAHANIVYAQANTARDQANTARDTANGAYSQANGAYAHANIVYAQANTARDQANTSRDQANTARDQANTARDTANGAYGQANGAYGQANNAANTVRVSANGGSTLDAKQLNFINTTSIQVFVASAADGTNANISFTTGTASVGDAYAQANAAYNKANTAGGGGSDGWILHTYGIT
jgi:hypothetical protein